MSSVRAAFVLLPQSGLLLHSRVLAAQAILDENPSLTMAVEELRVEDEDAANQATKAEVTTTV